MPEPDPPVGDHDQARCLGFLQCGDVDIEDPAGLGDQPEIGDRGGSDDEQRAPGRLGQPRGAHGERALDRGRNRQGAFDEAAGDGLGLAGELDQRERVAAGRAEEPLGAAVGHGIVALARQQRL